MTYALCADHVLDADSEIIPLLLTARAVVDYYAILPPYAFADFSFYGPRLRRRRFVRPGA